MAPPVFIVSDLHMGDKGPRDNFAHMSDGKREWEFNRFLDHVESQKGQLVILGDLFELWQGNVSRVVTCRPKLIDRLHRMKAIYVIGNHDIDLRYFRKGFALRHPFFHNIRKQLIVRRGGRAFLLIHGHEEDPYCRAENPGLGRISAIYSGLREDRNGSPLLGKYGDQTVETRSLGRWDRFTKIVRRCLGKPSLSQVLRQNIYDRWKIEKVAGLMFGHTHEPGTFYKNGCQLPIINIGSWAEHTPTFGIITERGNMDLFEWNEKITGRRAKAWAVRNPLVVTDR